MEVSTQIVTCSYCGKEHERTDCEALRVLGCVSRWVQVALGEDYRPAVDGASHGGAWANLPVEIAHSALLQRLVSGQEPLDLAPPRAGSYPWYDLYETGKGNVCDVFVPSEPLAGHSRPIIIDQGVWSLLDEREDGSWTVQWAEGHPLFHLRVHPAPEHRFVRYLMERIDD
jgi:hypothetical protein